MKAAFFDVDGTLVEGSLGISFCEYLTDENVFPKKNWDTMFETIQEYRGNKIDYQKLQEILVYEWKEGLKGLEERTVVNNTEKFIQTYDSIFENVPEIVELFKFHGYYTVAISTSPVEILELFKEKLDLDDVYGTIVRVKNNVYLNETEDSIVNENGKSELLLKIASEKNIDLQESYAFGDTAHDAHMLSLVGNPIALNPNNDLIQIAEKNNWRIYKDTTQLLEDLKSELIS